MREKNIESVRMTAKASLRKICQNTKNYGSDETLILAYFTRYTSQYYEEVTA